MKEVHIIKLPRVWLIGLLGSMLLSCNASPPSPSRSAPTPSIASATPTEAEAATDAELGAEERANIALFDRLSPSVVYVTNLAERRVGFSMDVATIPQGSGSGFVWDKKGTIVTNFHVVKDAQNVQVTLSDGSVWAAKPVGFEPDKDLAVISIDAPADKLTPIPVGRSGDLRVGQKVLAIGNPFGFDHTLTTGVISGLDREIQAMTGRPIQGVIQTDAAINPGNSGGPLLDSRGRLIGINTAIYSPSGAYAGIGFAVPVDTVGRLIPEILKDGKATKPGLGVQIASSAVTRRLQIEGVLILRVVPGGPADQIGLRPTARARDGSVVLGDILVGLNDKPLKDADDLYRALDPLKVGDKVTLEVLRDGKTEKVETRLERLD